LIFSSDCIPFAYILSTFFTNPLTARIIVIVVSFIFGPILSLVSFSLNLAGGDIKAINDQLIYIYRIFPGFNFGDGLLKIAANSTGASPWNSDIAGTAVSTLIWELFVYMAVIIIVEYLFSVPFIAKFIREKLKLEVDLPKVAEEEDSDVLREKERVSSGQADADAIQVRGLRKVYGGQKLAVKDLWYGIPKGECFGFLGINGAGK
jgi:ATP-binding cassette subfamily A (ABC1) protein 3